MKELIKPSFLSKVEFWAATTIYVFAVFFLITGNGESYGILFEQSLMPFDHYKSYIFPKLIQYTTFYLAFLCLNFKVIPKLLRKESLVLNLILVVLIFVIVGVILGISDTYLNRYVFQSFETEQETYNVIFQGSFHRTFWLLMMFGFYSFNKHTGLYLLSNSEAIQAKYRVVTRDGLAAVVLWMVSMFLLLLVNAEGEIIIGWGIVAPSAIILFCFSSYQLIPKVLGKKRPFWAYMWRVFLWLLFSLLPVGLLVLLFTHEGEMAVGYGFFNAAFQLTITAPICWLIYKRQIKGKEEVFVLQKELGRSNANFDFLRSQINPHFLFNTLNTLYGTALQENSERTAQGIQMLGDMMRFMLHENHQEKILLSREIEYMHNYIALQSLRTSSSPDILIETRIEEVVEEKFIAPMLLIPFVENAFKHGISLKQKSWIKVTLHYDQGKLFFDVYNSSHPKLEQDPERDKSGVGLENVKQRLNLVYPRKHELIIRETPEEYFVHLTLQL